MNTAYANDTEQSPKILLYAAGMLIIVSIGRIQEIFSFLQPLRLGMIAYILNIILILLFLNKKELKLKIKILPHSKILIALTCIVILSIPLSVWPGGSIKFFLDIYLYLLIFFIALLHAIRSEMDMKFVLGTALASFFIMTFFAVSGHEGGRISATSTYDANDFASLLVCAIPLIFYLAQTQKALSKFLSYCFLGMALIAVIYTGSRGGFVGLAVVLLVIFLKERRHMLRTLFLVTVVAIIGFNFADHEYLDRIRSIADPNDYNYHAEGGRLETWKRGLGFMLDNPLLGVGIGQYSTADGLSAGGREGWKWSTAHNSYIQIGAELGIGGLLLFLGLLFKSITVLRRLRKIDTSTVNKTFIGAMSNGLEVSIYGYMVTSLFLSHAYSSMLFFLLANVICLHAMVIRHEYALCADTKSVSQKNMKSRTTPSASSSI